LGGRGGADGETRALSLRVLGGRKGAWWGGVASLWGEWGGPFKLPRGPRSRVAAPVRVAGWPRDGSGVRRR
jgi:hypothetical protein